MNKNEKHGGALARNLVAVALLRKRALRKSLRQSENSGTLTSVVESLRSAYLEAHNCSVSLRRVLYGEPLAQKKENLHIFKGARNTPLSFELAKIASGHMYSDAVLRESVRRLEIFRNNYDGSDSTITKERITGAIAHCRLALHGVRDAHHELQDAALLIAAAEGLESSYGKAPPADQDPRWMAQLEGLRNVTAALRAANGPEAIKAEFDPANLRKYADDVDMKFTGTFENLDDGSMRAIFTKDAQHGMTYQLSLKPSSDGTKVVAKQSLRKGEEVIAESLPFIRDSLLSAIDAAVEHFDGLTGAPLSDLGNQTDAQALAERVARELGANLDNWVQSVSQEWVQSIMRTDDGKAIRVAASTGGVVNIEGDPFTPDQRRLPNTNYESVAYSMQIALDRAIKPVIPIKSDLLYTDAPGELGGAWKRLCDEENRLAGYLTLFQDGTAVVLGDDAWYLEKSDDGKLLLMRGEMSDGKIVNRTSRFDFGLDWVDMEIDALRDYTQRVSSVADDFLIDVSFWKTIKVEPEASPSLGL